MHWFHSKKVGIALTTLSVILALTTAIIANLAQPLSYRLLAPMLVVVLSLAATGSLLSLMSSRHRPEARGGRIFLLYASEDESVVRQLYDELTSANLNPWMDKRDLLPGQRRGTEMDEALRESDIVLACISRHTATEASFHQRLQLAMNVLKDPSKGMSPVIPVRLEDVEVPVDLRHFDPVDLFQAESITRLKRAITAALPQSSMVLIGQEEWYIYITRRLASARRSIDEFSLGPSTWSIETKSAQKYYCARERAIASESVYYRYVATYYDQADLARLDMVKAYIEKYGSRANFLAGYFDTREGPERTIPMLSFLIVDREEVIVGSYNMMAGPSDRFLVIVDPAAVRLFVEYGDVLWSCATRLNA